MENYCIFLARFGVLAGLVASALATEYNPPKVDNVIHPDPPSKAPEIYEARFITEKGLKGKVKLCWKLPSPKSWNGAIVKFKVIFWRISTNQTNLNQSSKYEKQTRVQYTIINNGNTTKAVIFGLYSSFTYVVKIKMCTKHGCGPPSKIRVLSSSAPSDPSEMVLLASDSPSFTKKENGLTPAVYSIIGGVFMGILILLAQRVASYVRCNLSRTRCSEPRAGNRENDVLTACQSGESAEPSSDEEMTDVAIVQKELCTTERHIPAAGALVSRPSESSDNALAPSPFPASSGDTFFARRGTPAQLLAWKLIDHKGGLLVIPNTDVSLYIPPKALPEGRSELIHISLEIDELKNSPGLAPNQCMLTPVVNCGPDGITFERPVQITMPHSAVVDDENKWKMGVKYSENQAEAEGWHTLLDPDGQEIRARGDSSYCINGKLCYLEVMHFTKFFLFGNAEENAEINLWALVYFTPPTVDTDCTVRVYTIPSTEASLKMVETAFEQPINGKRSDSPKLIRFNHSGGNIKIKLADICEGWKSENVEKEISFDDVKKGQLACPNVAFTFTRDSSSNVCQFSCTAEVQQMGKVGQAESFESSSVQVHVTTRIERNRSTSSCSSSGYASLVPYKPDDVHYKIPCERRRLLCILLDPKSSLTNDWRMLAERLECPRDHIRFWDRGLHQDASPTDKLLEWWECSQSERFPLRKVVKILHELDRDDAAKVIEELC